MYSAVDFVVVLCFKPLDTNETCLQSTTPIPLNESCFLF